MFFQEKYKGSSKFKGVFRHIQPQADNCRLLTNSLRDGSQTVAFFFMPTCYLIGVEFFNPLLSKTRLIIGVSRSVPFPTVAGASRTEQCELFPHSTKSFHARARRGRSK